MEETTVNLAFQEARKQKLKKVAEDIVKYQNFQASIACEKMNTNLAKSTKMNYITCGRYYIKTGNKYKGNVVGNNFYLYLQEAIDKHIQPLTPAFNERKREIKKDYTKKASTPPIKKIIEQKGDLTTKIEYGIKTENKVILELDENNARAFLRGLKFLKSDINAKLVTVELTEIE